MNKIILNLSVSLLAFLCGNLDAALPCPWGPKIEHCKPLPLIPANYEIVDLGETPFSPEELDRFAVPQTYAPRVSNGGLIAYNTEKGAVIRQIGGELVPWLNRVEAQCFGLNDKGELLLSSSGSQSRVSWSLWVIDNLRKIKQVSICGEGLPGSNMYLRSLNNNGVAVGALRPAGSLRPLYWSQEQGLHHLGYFLGWDIEGIAWNVNDRGTVVGTFYPPSCEPQICIPFAWNEKWGLERLHDYRYPMRLQLRRKLNNEAIQFYAPVIDNEDTVYGQVSIDEEMYSYTWYPRTNEFRLGDLGKLKFNAVNNNYIFAGSAEGEAVLYQRYLEPILLSDRVANLPEDWELIEITDVNDAAIIVGFGKYKGVYHLFQGCPAAVKAVVDALPKEEQPRPQKEIEKQVIDVVPEVDHMKYSFGEKAPAADGMQKINFSPSLNGKE